MGKRITTLTPSGVTKILATISLLKNRYASISRELASADIDQDERKEKRQEQEYLLFDIKKLEQTIAGANIASDTDHTHHVELGTHVTYRYKGKIVEVTLVDPLEADPLSGYISVQSPVGAALIGHHPNETVDVTTPTGTTKLTILSLT